MWNCVIGRDDLTNCHDAWDSGTANVENPVFLCILTDEVPGSRRAGASDLLVE